MNIKNECFLFFNNLFCKKQELQESSMKKILIAGLGNIGEEYHNTRHNVGFKIVDAFVKKHQETFSAGKLAALAKFKIKGKTVFVLKPGTFMNLSGKAVLYWMKKENIQIENLLVITDDLNIGFGKIRIKRRGSAGGHNGLKDIQDKLNTDSYPRFRFGIGTDYQKGKQVDFVLGKWSQEEECVLTERMQTNVNAVTSFITAGLSNTMNQFNGK